MGASGSTRCECEKHISNSSKRTTVIAEQARNMLEPANTPVDSQRSETYSPLGIKGATHASNCHQASPHGKKKTTTKKTYMNTLCVGKQIDMSSGDIRQSTDQVPISPAVIRRQRLEELQAARPQLSDHQLELLSQTWHALQSHLIQVGSDIFVRLFESYPDVKGAFGVFGSMDPEDARYSKVLQDHGLRVLGTVQLVIDNRHNPDCIITQLHQLGNKHVTFNAKPDYMDIVSQMFMFAIEPVLQDHWSPEVEDAWATLFNFIKHVMKETMLGISTF